MLAMHCILNSVWLRNAYDNVSIISNGGRGLKYLLSSLALIVHLELNHDTLIEVVGGALNIVDVSAK